MAEQDQQSRSTGKVSRFGDVKGYGFITPDEGGEDLFVHQSAIKSEGYRSLIVGETVEFTVSTGNSGKEQAIDVTAIGGSAIVRKDRRGGSGYAGGRGGGDRNAGCYNCNGNHRARDCDQEVVSDRSIRNRRDGNGGGGCYNCGESGHFARECKKDNESGGGGAAAAAAAAGKCYSCGKFGHFARDCRVLSVGGQCYSCGGVGHLARECVFDNNRGSGGARRIEGGRSCFNCGIAGHFARECPSNVQASA